MGFAGIMLEGDSIIIEFMHLRSNAQWGILLGNGDGRIVRQNSMTKNGGSGLLIDNGLVTENVSSSNGIDGISVNGPALVSRNLLTNNKRLGLAGAPILSYSGNLISGNGDDRVFGTNQGQNLCGNAACPGAVF
jgi:hypothetical protein